MTRGRCARTGTRRAARARDRRSHGCAVGRALETIELRRHFNNRSYAYLPAHGAELPEPTRRLDACAHLGKYSTLVTSQFSYAMIYVAVPSMTLPIDHSQQLFSRCFPRHCPSPFLTSVSCVTLQPPLRRRSDAVPTLFRRCSNLTPSCWRDVIFALNNSPR